jgi:hypothetical protein
MASYWTQNQWGGSSAAWNPGGTFVLGLRPGQNVVAINITSSDSGKTFTGTMTYAGEGPIGFKGTQVMPNNYSVQNQWGGDSAPWHDAGYWVIGARCPQPLVAMDVTSSDGSTLTGTITYEGEGPIGFTGSITG